MKAPRLFVLLAMPAMSCLLSFQNSPAPSRTKALPSPAERSEESQGEGPGVRANPVPVHDPCIVKEGSTYYVFATGPGVPVQRSTDLVHWEAAGRVFEGEGPEWIKKEIPQSRGMWAPDICYYGGRYHLTYAVSTFGSNRSLIGAASNKTLDPAGKDFKWIDEGKVVESTRQDNYNAIDSNILPLNGKRLALTFGSFWSGIKLVYLDAKTGKPEKPGEVVPLAQRPSPDALEAPFLVRRGRYFYLFVSFDFCCRGVRSTYNIRVGRAEKVEGPYLDKESKPMLEGGGTPLLATEGNRIGPGHCAVLRDTGKDYLVYHYYDGTRNGFPTLQITPRTWR